MWMRCHKIDWGNLAAALKKRGKNKAKRAKDNKKKKRKPPNKWNKIIVASIAAILWLDPQKKVSSRQNIERGQQQPPNKSDRSRGICWYFFFFSCFFVSYSPFSFCCCLGFSFVLLSRLAQSMQIAHTTRWRKVASRQPTMSPKIEPNNKWEELWAKQVDLGIPFKEFFFYF